MEENKILLDQQARTIMIKIYENHQMMIYH